MYKFRITVFIRKFSELILVLLQFLIIILHFIQLEIFTRKEIMKMNSIFSLMGYLVIIFASICMVIAIKELGSNLSPFPRPKACSKLITSGIYSLMRHPIYYSLILLSFGVFITKLSFYYLFLTISLTLIIKLKIILEDHYLSNKFKNYLLYKNKVKY